jgi:hypothetical protein
MNAAFLDPLRTSPGTHEEAASVFSAGPPARRVSAGLETSKQRCRRKKVLQGANTIETIKKLHLKGSTLNSEIAGFFRDL